MTNIESTQKTFKAIENNTEIDLDLGDIKSLIEVSQNYFWQVTKMQNKSDALQGLNNLFTVLNQASNKVIEEMEMHKELELKEA